MEESNTGGFLVNTQSVDDYITTVDKAVANFKRIGDALVANQNGSWDSLLGGKHLAGSTEFTDTCEHFMGLFVELHNDMAAKQQAIVQWMTGFRNQISESNTLYRQTEDQVAESFRRLADSVGHRGTP